VLRNDSGRYCFLRKRVGSQRKERLDAHSYMPTSINLSGNDFVCRFGRFVLEWQTNDPPAPGAHHQFQWRSIGNLRPMNSPFRVDSNQDITLRFTLFKPVGWLGSL
jgi:hypothetical protein